MNENKVKKYNDVIADDRDFTGEKFREVLQSHGISIYSLGQDFRQIKIDAHGEYPDMYINVTSKGHILDKYLFSELHGKYKIQNDKVNGKIPSLPIEERLKYLNGILLNSGYVGEKITLQMLNSEEKLSLKAGELAELELAEYKKAVENGNLSSCIFFNNPNGEDYRRKLLDERMSEKFVVNFEPQENVKVDDKNCKTKTMEVPRTPDKENNTHVDNSVRITAEIGGQTVNLCISQELQQKLMAMDSSHRFRLINRLLDNNKIENLSSQDRSSLVCAVDNEIFSKPSIFVSSMSDCKKESPVINLPPKADNAAAMSANKFDCLTEDVKAHSVEISRGGSSVGL